MAKDLFPSVSRSVITPSRHLKLRLGVASDIPVRDFSSAFFQILFLLWLLSGHPWTGQSVVACVRFVLRCIFRPALPVFPSSSNTVISVYNLKTEQLQTFVLQNQSTL